MTLGEKLDSAWLDSLDYWSDRTTREPGMRELVTKRLPPIMVCVVTLGVIFLLRATFHTTDGSYLTLVTLGPVVFAWFFFKASNTRARQRFDARPERVPERVEVVERSLKAAAGKTEQAMAATQAALAQSHQLSADLQAQLDSLAEALSRTHAESQQARILADLSESEAQAVASRLAETIKPEVRHLDRMGLMYAASGWVAAVLVLVFDRYIPRW